MNSSLLNIQNKMLIFFTEARFLKIENDYYALDSSFSYKLFERYLKYFDRIIICARVKEGLMGEVLEANKVSKGNVEVVPLPYYVGFNQFIMKYFLFNKAVKQAIKKLSNEKVSFLCRIPGRVGAVAISHLRKKKISYGVEVVGDPYDVLSNGATRHPLIKLIRFFSAKSLRKIAWEAPAAIYVTESKLQERYPNNNYNVGVSDVHMPEHAYIRKEDIIVKDSDELTLICIGTLEQMYKAPDVMLKALKLIIDRGYKSRLLWIGDGLFKQKMMELAESIGISDSVSFIGKLPSGNAVREKLDNADIFIMPSRMEGLPRAMVEAMARGLPCIGTKLCGIQELLENKMLVEVNDIEGLATKIIEAIDSYQLRSEQAEINLTKSLNYRESLLEPKREVFYKKLSQSSL
jgi:glycosyltransferase involved in cell wall biosynthesis